MRQLHEAIRRCGHLPRHTWILAVASIAFIAGHGVILTYALSHAALSTGVVGGLIVLVVIKHLGVLAPIYSVLGRRFRRDWQ